MPLQAEFTFKGSRPAQHQKILYLQIVVLAVVASFILLLIDNIIVCILLELILFLVLIRARSKIAMAASVESLIVRSESAVAIIDGRHYALSTYGLGYFSRWLAAVRLTTAAGASYCFFVFPGLIGAGKYRQLISLLKAR